MRTAVINVVGLTSSLLRQAPRLSAWAGRGRVQRLRPVLPAVTCSVQSSMLTGKLVSEHGIVGNGWYDRTACEVQFWKQSNRLVQGEKVWEAARARDASMTCANMFWWYNMYSSADWSVTPRPQYRADGRKIPDCYSEPPELRDELQAKLGTFPLFRFWGPATTIESSRWIAEASMMVHERVDPSLMLIYLPHLDYDLQRLGPDDRDIWAAVKDIDGIVERLIEFFEQRETRVMVLSEYGIEAVSHPIEINRILRREGLIRVRVENGRELLDPGASAAFAVADHQVAHVYVNESTRLGAVATILRSVEGIEHVLDRDGQRAFGIDHERAGDLVLVAARGAWFAYQYWQDDARAPDFARTVDIHHKPGYDPLELFLDPALKGAKMRIARRLVQKKLGFRALMDVIPLDNSLVRGSHGRIDQPADEQPLLITPDGGAGPDELPCTAVREVILEALAR